MATTTAPLLSFGASGAIAKTQVYASWKGRPYARRYVIPSNPNTAEQQLTRSVFAWLNNVWKFMPSGAIDAWVLYGRNSRFTDRNGFIKKNLSNLREESDLANFIFSPSAGGGLAAASSVSTGGALQVTIVPVAPTLPTGWTISRAIAAVIKQQDPNSGTLYQVSSGEDATSAYSINITGLTAATAYVTGVWFEYIKPDGSFAYGEALMSTATTS